MGVSIADPMNVALEMVICEQLEEAATGTGEFMRGRCWYPRRDSNPRPTA